ncbi:MAPEG family protein [Lyngbya confervoides]|uniref:MAPEG family protein n=1 Tax=Lyngbya confervoides BDU141951 TaxID=1574623 RepID=A0ABD4T222_9CYAN|nr:MAPEG family protein [Lyngbya confervoides]MCM1982436.1 MAPEG family protein [Lyngbya confervoides BDU141951]
MPPELTCLMILALWSLVLNHLPAIARIAKGGVAWGLGNRESLPETASWVGRADRAQRNHHDNLPLIAIVLITAVVTGQRDQVTQIAALVILIARLAHGLFYLAGIGLLRSGAYAISIAALLTVVWRLWT